MKAARSEDNMKKISKKVVVVLIICMSIVTMSYAEEIQSNSFVTSADGFYVIETESYLNTSGPTTILLPDVFREKLIDGISLLYENDFAPAEIEVNKNVITIAPSDYLKNEKSYTIRIFTSDDSQYVLNLTAYALKDIDFSENTLVLIPPKPEEGFNYPYYLKIPKNADKSQYKRLIVETNNTGRVSDVLGVHQESALWIAKGASVGGFVADVLNMPILVPVFPRPLTEWWDNYYHTLSRDVMLKESGDGKRVDLQLIAMIEDARELLASYGLTLEKKIFMTGFSASGQFANRFTVLHPEWVKAVFHGGFTMYPTDKINGNTLYFPLGTADIEKLTGKKFNLEEYKKIAQFVFTGDLDRNDRIVETAEDYNAYDAKVMHNLYKTEEPMKIWARKEDLMNKIGFGSNIQFHVYKGIGHGIPSAAFHDSIKFFKANYNDGDIKKIEPIDDAWYWYPEEIEELWD